MKSERMIKIDALVMLLKELKPDISPVRLQKSMYFLYAYYYALYSKELYGATFEAWQYGSVNRVLYEKWKNGYYENLGILKPLESEEKLFVQDLFSQMCEVSEFTLIERNLADDTFQSARKTESKLINNQELIKEYRTKYVEVEDETSELV